MIYQELYHTLKTAFDRDQAVVTLPELGVQIAHYNFNSGTAADILGGSHQLCCRVHQLDFEDKYKTAAEQDHVLDLSDYEIACNRDFRIHLIQSSDVALAEGFIVLLHGLNEKKWDKYLPWAYELARNTKKAVVLFPIAFHMDRAPAHWSDRKEMHTVAQERAADPGNAASSFINAAISARMEKHPQRLFWSGLQTYSDMLQLLDMVRNGHIPSISRDAQPDLFGYSIGSFLSCILLMANPGGLFEHSKLFCFCGGMTIDRMFPISKYIMDARSSITMQSGFAELLSSGFASDPHLGHYQDKALHRDESWFKTMLRYNYFQKERESRLLELQDQIQVLVLKNDDVAPPIEALNTLQGGYRDIPIQVHIDDYTHAYSHINPFPVGNKQAEHIDQAFRRFTKMASDFLQ